MGTVIPLLAALLLHKIDYSCGDQCNGNAPSFDNPDCWPGAIYCPPASTPEDTSVARWDGHQWVSGATAAYGPAVTPGSPCGWANQ